ncbi:MAG: porphobilinogen synthase [Verrucomicrobiota bacterium]
MTTQPFALDLVRRPRRNRRSAGIRAMLRETHLRPEDLIQPLFVTKSSSKPVPIESLPGQYRLPEAALVRECEELLDLGIRAVALFPQIEPELKNASGTYATVRENWFHETLGRLKETLPDLIVIADVALDPYTDHGHDGLIDEDYGDVANDATVEVLTDLAVHLAAHGADFVAPSDMMDGRVSAIRLALDDSGFNRTGIISYAAKFNSAFYGPFRDAVGSQQAAGAKYLDKSGYQLDPANAREAAIEARLDEDEGADVIMIKPAGHYLDVIRDIRLGTSLPVAAYQVSGEYAALHAAAEHGWLELTRARDEALLAIRRAGADLILTYFAKAKAQDLRAGGAA